MPYRLKQTLHGHISAVSALAQCGETTEILSASNDFSAKSWKCSPRIGYQVVGDFAGHNEFITCASFIPPSEHFPSGLCVSGGLDKKVIMFTPFDQEIVQVVCFESAVTSLYVIDNTLLLVAFQDGMVMLLKLTYEEGKVECEVIQNFIGHTSAVWSVIYTDGYVISASEEHDVLIFEKSDDIYKKIAYPINQLLDHPAGVQALAPLHQLKQFLSAGNDGVIRRWSACTGTCLQVISLHQTFVMAIAVSPDNTFFTSCAEDEVCVWHNAFSDEGDIVAEKIDFSDSACSITILPNNNIVIGSSDGDVHVYAQVPERDETEDTLTNFDDEMEDDSHNQLTFEDINMEDLHFLLDNCCDAVLMDLPVTDVSCDGKFLGGTLLGQLDDDELQNLIRDILPLDYIEFESYFPQKELIAYVEATEEDIKRTLYMLGSSTADDRNPRRCHIRKLLNPLNKPSQKGIQALLRILCNRSEVGAFPAIKIITYIIRYEAMNEILCSGFRGRFLIDMLNVFTKKESLENNKVLSFGLLSNMLLHPIGRELFHKNRFLINLNLISVVQDQMSEGLQIALATFYLNLSVCYGEGLKTNPRAIEIIDYYKKHCEALLTFLTNEEAIYRNVIALGSFMTYSEKKTLKQSTIDFIQIQHSFWTEEKLLTACHLLIAYLF